MNTQAIFAIKRPHPSLRTYYLFAALKWGPGFPFGLIYYLVRYQTLRYDIDEQGISMRWGRLFRREITLTYDRIQDIHLSSNFVERWLGLARVQIQTASGQAKAEMTLEGLPNYEALRDFLYTKMPGVRNHLHQSDAVDQIVDGLDKETVQTLTDTLSQVTVELRAIRLILQAEKEATPLDDHSA